MSIDVHHLRCFSPVVFAGVVVVRNISRFRRQGQLNDREKLAYSNLLFHQRLSHLHDEGVEAVSHLLNLVQKGDGRFSLYTGGIAPPHHVVAVHDLVEEVATRVIVAPVVGLNQHGPSQWAEQLRLTHHLIFDF